MTKSRSLSRELALLVLGQIPEKDIKDFELIDLDRLLQIAVDSLTHHFREGLDNCATQMELANKFLYDSEQLTDSDKFSFDPAREYLRNCLERSEQVLNGLSVLLEMPRLLLLADQEEIRTGATSRVYLVTQKSESIDARLDEVMEGWRLKRLPRIDRDILRLAFVDMTVLKTPIAVACNEAVELAHRYSDEQGRRMINGVLRRLQDSSSQIRA